MNLKPKDGCEQCKASYGPWESIPDTGRRGAPPTKDLWFVQSTEVPTEEMSSIQPPALLSTCVS